MAKEVFMVIEMKFSKTMEVEPHKVEATIKEQTAQGYWCKEHIPNGDLVMLIFVSSSFVE